MLRKKTGSKDLTQRTPRKKKERERENAWCGVAGAVERKKQALAALGDDTFFFAERTLLTPDWSFGQLATALLAEDKGFYGVAEDLAVYGG
jgi:hypothetical protein